MDYIFGADWRSIFMPTMPLAELLVRGTAVYLGLFLLLRFVLRRELGTVGIADLLLIVLLADAAQNAMGDYQSVTDGLLLVGTLVFWNYTLDYLAYRSPVLRRIIKPRAILLVRNGKILYDHMAKEKISEDELMSAVRSHGVDSLDKVWEVRIEPDGMISVITQQARAGTEAPDSSGNDKKRSQGL